MTTQQEALIQEALKHEGVPYKYGAKMEDAPDAFDCSGFIKYCYQQVGYDIPRSTIEQAEFAGEKVEDITHLEPGDLIFIHGERGHYNKTFPQGIGHVVMYVGDNKVVHAASKRVQEQPNIIEEGGVKVSGLDEVIQRSGPVVVIKRIFKEE
jgi:peptidoglycan endopeptidase LytE